VVAAGDNVEVSFETNDVVAIEKVLPRRQYLSRPDLLNPDKKKIIAANLDQLVIVVSTKDPPFRAGLVDRFLVSAEKESLKAIIVINKIDLSNRKRFAEYEKNWILLGCEQVYTSAMNGAGIDDLKSILRNKTSALAGHSGVGKSSLLNVIQPSLNIKTQKISRASGKGVHTTTSVVFYPLDIGGWVADTPGLKVFGLTGITRKNLDRFFPDFAEKIDRCKFADCLHISEPDCAVKQAVATGEIFESRYQSYLKLWNQLDG
jgi:ribosome biogenesis GTPase